MYSSAEINFFKWVKVMRARLPGRTGGEEVYLAFGRCQFKSVIENVIIRPEAVLDALIPLDTVRLKKQKSVFFHGGGDSRGSTQQIPYDSPALATRGVIVVTAEYRLGSLGFFVHPLLTKE